VATVARPAYRRRPTWLSRILRVDDLGLGVCPGLFRLGRFTGGPPCHASPPATGQPHPNPVARVNGRSNALRPRASRVAILFRRLRLSAVPCPRGRPADGPLSVGARSGPRRSAIGAQTVYARAPRRRSRSRRRPPSWPDRQLRHGSSLAHRYAAPARAADRRQRAAAAPVTLSSGPRAAACWRRACRCLRLLLERQPKPAPGPGSTRRAAPRCTAARRPTLIPLPARRLVTDGAGRCWKRVPYSLLARSLRPPWRVLPSRPGPQELGRRRPLSSRPRRRAAVAASCVAPVRDLHRRAVSAAAPCAADRPVNALP